MLLIEARLKSCIHGRKFISLVVKILQTRGNGFFPFSYLSQEVISDISSYNEFHNVRKQEVTKRTRKK